MDNGERGAPLFQHHHIKIMKVALAIAIIRQKPPSISALDYTISLAEEFKGSEVTWRSRAKHLARELLRTRQELAKCRLQSLTVASGREGGLAEEAGLEGSGYSPMEEGEGLAAPAAAGGVGCEGSGSTRSLERASLEGEELGWGGGGELEAHIQFCTSISRLLSIQERLPLIAECLDTVKDTLLDSIAALERSLTASFPSTQHDQDMLASAMSCLTGAANLEDFICKPEMTSIQQDLVEVTTSLTDTLLSKNRSELIPEQVQWVESSLLTLCGAQPVLTHVVQTLSQQLCTSADLLSQTVQGEVLIDSSMVDSAESQLATLQTLLSKYNAKNIESEIRSKLVKDLEESILELSSTYPLFTYAVWRVVALLTK